MGFRYGGSEVISRYVAHYPGAQKVGFAAVLVTAVLAAADHRSVYAPRQKANNNALASYVKEYLKGTDPDSVIIYLGFDWSPVWPYDSERRALMIPGWGSTDSDVRKALANLRGYKIGGVFFNDAATYAFYSLSLHVALPTA